MEIRKMMCFDFAPSSIIEKLNGKHATWILLHGKEIDGSGA
jgi:hypothetical protein